MMRRAVLAAPVAALVSGLSTALLVGCTADAGSAGNCGADSPGAIAGGAGFAEVLALSAPTADYAWYPETVTAALPSVRYLDEAGEPTPPNSRPSAGSPPGSPANRPIRACGSST